MPYRPVAWLLAGLLICGVTPAAEDAAGVRLALGEAVALLVRENRDLHSARLQQVVDKYARWVAEEDFRPRYEVNARLRRGGDNLNRASADFSASVQLESGGQFAFVWERAYQDGADWNEAQGHAGSWQARFIHPLLRGAGQDIATAERRLARLREQSGWQDLRATYIEQITQLIFLYRDFLRAWHGQAIYRSSLSRSRKLLQINEELIRAGRMAAMEIVQTQADVAAKNLSYRAAQNALANARLSLLKRLDIDKHMPVEPVSETQLSEPPPAVEHLLELALANRPDFLAQRLAVTIAEIELAQARDQQRWQLDLEATYGLSTESGETALQEWLSAGKSDWEISLALKIPLNDVRARRDTVVAEVALRQARLALARLRDTLEIELMDAVRDIAIRREQVTLARQALDLAEKTLAIEEEKLQVGRSSNFQLLSFQDALQQAQNEELDARMAYLNALTELDRLTGTSLQTWRIDLRQTTREETSFILPPGLP